MKFQGVLFVKYKRTKKQNKHESVSEISIVKFAHNVLCRKRDRPEFSSFIKYIGLINRINMNPCKLLIVKGTHDILCDHQSFSGASIARNIFMQKDMGEKT